MDWMRSREQLHSGAAPVVAVHSAPLDVKKEPVPKFVLVDANNRVRELTGASAAMRAAAGASFTSSSASSLSFGSQPMTHHPFGAHAQDDDYGMTQAELEEQAQLEQQLQVQKEEMRFVSPLPRPQLHNNPNQQQRPLLFANHAFTYSDPNSSQQQFVNPLRTPPTVLPVSPFAGLALSAPAKSTLATAAANNSKLPNPFSSSLSTTIESSPRLPSLNVFRAGSPGQLKMGIAGPRPPPLSLRSSSESYSSGSLSSHASPSTHSSSSSFSFQPSSFSSSRGGASPMYSQSLPSSSFMHLSQSSERRVSRMSFDDAADSVNMSSDDEDVNGMQLLSSSVERASSLAAGGIRSGRVCRYADCNNIARSRGLCRTHGGGKRCSHPHCNKSAQANRKCIAHGGGTPCSFGDCEKTAQSRGLCKAHGGGARCKHPDCPKSSQSKGLCRGHGGGIKCKEDGCEKWVQKNGYCIKHGRERSMTS
uniref:WRKY19-like zinc finger domain-containing protein n=1 Tax=Globisporangium ultimum (strain ATCC 200006 / CBS 805.95 / DAOM BR144) TaxID=431595 RepID=K3WYW6_GLOUD